MHPSLEAVSWASPTTSPLSVGCGRLHPTPWRNVDHASLAKISAIRGNSLGSQLYTGAGTRRAAFQEPLPLTIEDRELIDRVRAGDTEVFRLLVERHQQTVFRFALGMTGDREEALDIAQEAFLAAFTRLKVFDDSRASFRTWLLTITRNRSINHLKRMRPQRLETPEAVEGQTPLDAVDGQELGQQLDAALARLPHEQRAAFVLAEIDGLAYADIAVIEQTNIGTVKSRVHRAKQKLQSLLEPLVRDST